MSLHCKSNDLSSVRRRVRLDRPTFPAPERSLRGGFTLIELIVAMAVTMMIVGAMAGLTRTVQQEFEYSDGYGATTQHARVLLDRIAQNMCQAAANERFPGCLVVAEQVGEYRYPDTLVLWRPSGSPADAAGLPRYNELLVYCPHPSLPNQLVELTVPDDLRTVPPPEDEAAWQAAMTALKKDAATKMVVLSDLVRACSTSARGEGNWRAAVRFEIRLRPSAADWENYKSGGIDWMNLPWVQGIYGSTAGLRQVWVRMEVQMTPGARWAASDPAAAQAIPYFGSATRYYQMPHP